MWKTPRSLAVAGVALAAGLGVGAVALPAFAAQDPVLTEDQQSTLQAQIDAYQSCLESQGVTLPEKPADGTRPEITDEQRDAMRAAREACQDQRPERPQLTDEQRAELGITDSLLRLSVGIEDVNDIIADIETALK